MLIPESHLLSVAICKYQLLLCKYQLLLLWQVCYPHLMDEVRLSDWTKVSMASDQVGSETHFS